MGSETERKFLVLGHAWATVQKPKGVDITHGYLCQTSSAEVRVSTRNDGKAKICFKSPVIMQNGRSEYEYEIPYADAQEMSTQMATAWISKTRYLIPVGDDVWEVDEFFYPHTHLIMAELELKEGKSWPTEWPLWIGQEVTFDPRYQNANLAKITEPQ